MADSFDGRALDPSSPIWASTELPHLRSLVRSGTNFVRAYSPSPECTPARSALFTGRRTEQIKVWSNGMGIAQVPGTKRLDRGCERHFPECSELASLQNVTATLDLTLSAGGVNVSLIGKMHIGAGYSDRDQGRVFSGTPLRSFYRAAGVDKPRGRPTETGEKVGKSGKGRFRARLRNDAKILTRCRQTLRKLPRTGASQLVYCSFNTPHPPYETNGAWFGRINESQILVPPQLPMSQVHPADMYRSFSLSHWRDYPDNHVKIVRRVYSAMLLQLDSWVGDILRELDTREDRNDWVVLFTSDHGDMQMEQRMTLKYSMFDGSVRVPLVWAGPGIAKNKIVKKPASLIDIYPTLHDLTGVPLPDFLSGHSLVPSMKEDRLGLGQSLKSMLSRESSVPSTRTSKLRGDRDDRPDFVTSQFHSSHSHVGIFMVATEEYKLVSYGTHRNLHPELFTAKLYVLDGSDPWELNDVASEKPEVVRSLMAKLNSEFDPSLADQSAKDLQLHYFKIFTARNWDENGMACGRYFGHSSGKAKQISQWSGLPCVVPASAERKEHQMFTMEDFRHRTPILEAHVELRRRRSDRALRPRLKNRRPPKELVVGPQEEEDIALGFLQSAMQDL